MTGLLIGELLEGYRSGRISVVDVATATVDAAEGADPAMWIDLIDRRSVLDRARRLDAAEEGADSLPLYGIPFAVKDNIDVAGRPTTVGCPGYAYVAGRSAPAVSRLEAAGAVLIGKTNLDQFATGLDGTRSPYGIPRNPAAPGYIPGGSSSGSATVVAGGIVPLALGTDTAGSGRVPAAMTGIVGLKPTRGLVSTVGVVPACRSLDCISVFTADIAGAAAALRVLDAYDPDDPYARTPGRRSPRGRYRTDLRVGVFDVGGIGGMDAPAVSAFADHVRRLEDIGARIVPLDPEPFLAVGDLLYNGPFLAERWASVGPFLEASRPEVLDVTAMVIERGRRYSAADLFGAEELLRRLDARCRRALATVEVLAVPSVPCAVSLEDVDPFRTSPLLGTFTNFVNLLDLAAIAVPGGRRSDGVPVGVTLIGEALSEDILLETAVRFLGEEPIPADSRTGSAGVRVAVVGAHLAGQPLHHELVARSARLVARTTTSPRYRLFALAGTAPAKPGLMRDDAGTTIEVEVYELDEAGLGGFVDGVPAPLAVGKVELADGTWVNGFVCEPGGLVGAEDITSYGSWRSYVGG